PGQLQLVLTESTDSGLTWLTKFTTPLSIRAGEPALAILPSGTIGLLFDTYDPSSDTLAQRFLQTADDFVTGSDSLLATESNAAPTLQFSPYLGDFFDLQGVGNNFYGIFSASNADNGTAANFFGNVTFQRN